MGFFFFFDWLCTLTKVSADTATTDKMCEISLLDEIVRKLSNTSSGSSGESASWRDVHTDVLVSQPANRFLSKAWNTCFGKCSAESAAPSPKLWRLPKNCYFPKPSITPVLSWLLFPASSVPTTGTLGGERNRKMEDEKSSPHSKQSCILFW